MKIENLENITWTASRHDDNVLTFYQGPYRGEFTKYPRAGRFVSQGPEFRLRIHNDGVLVVDMYKPIEQSPLHHLWNAIAAKHQARVELRERHRKAEFADWLEVL